MNIYTKTGDEGLTSLANGQRVKKNDLRLQAYGTVDEVNSYIGWLRACLTDQSAEWQVKADTQLKHIQNILFDIGAILAGSDLPFPSGEDTQIEQWIDEMAAILPTCHAFILPAGSERIGRCHICRTQVRRMERAILQWMETDAESIDSNILRFVNRLSDYCFILAKSIGQNEGIAPCFWEK